MHTVHVHVFESELGTFRSAATDRGLVLLHLPGSSEVSFYEALHRLFPGHKRSEASEISLETERQITAYLAGELTEFTVPIDLRGTSFQRKVLDRVAAIPYGETRSYRRIAEEIGSGKAARAVGAANASNKVPIVIPCHRVVGTTGLGGYGGGLEMKKRLLELERAAVATGAEAL